MLLLLMLLAPYWDARTRGLAARASTTTRRWKWKVAELRKGRRSAAQGGRMVGKMYARH